jgi:phage terminase small subunit|tara:strand:+ start:124 stop:549 length:426 start_codon:yes stop_codon:yes gene_type:complete
MSYLPKEHKKEKKLTEKQQLFLDKILETGGNLTKAAELAGYSGNYHQPLKALKEEVIDLASDVLARSAPKAAFKLLEVLESDRPIPQANNKLQAAQTILDRVGLAKSDRVQVDHNVPGGIFILPEKESLPVVEGDYETIPD